MNFLIEKCTQKEALQIFCSASYNLSVFFIHQILIRQFTWFTYFSFISSHFYLF